MQTCRTYVVDQSHPQATDEGEGDEQKPFRTINAAAALALAGDTVLIKGGIYRERVDPAHGGEHGRPITYCAAIGDQVFIRGSEEFRPQWQEVPGMEGVLKAAVPNDLFGPQAYAGHVDTAVYGDCNFLKRNFDRALVVRPLPTVGVQLGPEESSGGMTTVVTGASTARSGVLPTTLGQIFWNSKPLTEVETYEDLKDLSGTWLVDEQAENIFVHFPHSPQAMDQHLVEISVRHTVFSPLKRGLGHIILRGLIIEHGCNHFPTWGGAVGWAQQGLISTRSGHHWLIEGCTVRYAKSVGIDCGSEGGDETTEQPGDLNPGEGHNEERFRNTGWHVIRDNLICDNGLCGICGLGHRGTQILGNLIERNNRTGYTSPWWEMAGIKFHFFYDGLIEGNLIRDNDCHGIWLDNQWRGSRITRNVIINNLWSGINLEWGTGPMLVDTNVVAYTRQGDGIYGHDLADVTIAHNLLYANANFGVWVAYATPRVPPENGCWDIKTYNNLVLGNRAGAIGYSLPWKCAGNNVSDGNLFMGAGDYLDEGSGTLEPLFQFNNKSHCAQYQGGCHGSEPMVADKVAELFAAAMDRAQVQAEDRPNLNEWKRHFMVNFDLWRAVTGNDRASRVTKAIRDGLQSRLIAWEFKFDDVIRQVSCSAIAGVDRDFRGRPMPARPLPGPFQDVIEGQNHIALWPVRGVPTTQILT